MGKSSTAQIELWCGDLRHLLWKDKTQKMHSKKKTNRNLILKKEQQKTKSIKTAQKKTKKTKNNKQNQKQEKTKKHTNKRSTKSNIHWHLCVVAASLLFALCFRFSPSDPGRQVICERKTAKKRKKSKTKGNKKQHQPHINVYWALDSGCVFYIVFVYVFVCVFFQNSSLCFCLYLCYSSNGGFVSFSAFVWACCWILSRRSRHLARIEWEITLEA